MHTSLVHLAALLSASILPLPRIAATPLSPKSVVGQKRQEDSTSSEASQLHPLDYAPDFSNDPFPPYPDIYQADGSNFTAENWRGTRLFGWVGCDKGARNIITETWDDFYKLAQQPSLYKNIDWDSQASKEIWGDPVDQRKQLSDHTKSQIQQIFQSTQQMYDNRWLPPYLWDPPWLRRKLWIRVRCSPDGDLKKWCSESKPGQCPPGNTLPPKRKKNEEEAVEAYSEPENDYSTVTFCSYFFNDKHNMRSLGETMDEIRKGNRAQNDLWSYQNRARVMFHEMTHANYFMNTPDKSPYVDDLKIDLKGPKSSEVKNLASYGPERIKYLANYESVGKGGFYTQRNADSYAWFAMANWAEKLGFGYPFQPVIGRRPLRAPRDGDNHPFDFSTADKSDSPVEANGQEDIILDETHPVPYCADVVVPSANTASTDAAETGSHSCSDEDVTDIPYNVFYSQDSATFWKFCYEFDHTQEVEWKVDVNGDLVEDAAGLVRRTPPPDLDDFSSARFTLRWQPDSADSNCLQDVDGCMLAFANLTNSECGRKGDKGNLLTRNAQLDMPDCGTYSWSVSDGSDAEPSEPKPEPATPSLGSQWCFPKFDGHDDIQRSAQKKAAEDACANADGHMVVDGDPSTNIHSEPTNWAATNAYLYDVYWIKDCTSTISKMDAGKPLSDQPGVTCTGLLENDFVNCDNGGVGGNITVGCLAYRFSIGDKP